MLFRSLPRSSFADPRDVAAALVDEHANELRGRPGADGAGIDAPLWRSGAVYREGFVVSAHVGQLYRAARDTVGVPGESADWARIGVAGFRHRGTFDKDATYVDGDLYVKDFGTFVMINGVAVLFAHRGMKGERGESVKGEPGTPGKHGRDGATITGAQARGFKLVLVVRAADGSIDHVEADFTSAFQEAIAIAVRELLREDA